MIDGNVSEALHIEPKGILNNKKYTIRYYKTWQFLMEISDIKQVLLLLIFIKN